MQVDEDDDTMQVDEDDDTPENDPDDESTSGMITLTRRAIVKGIKKNILSAWTPARQKALQDEQTRHETQSVRARAHLPGNGAVSRRYFRGDRLRPSWPQEESK